MHLKFETITLINKENDPIIIKKEDKFIAVSIEYMSDKYVVTFDIIDESNINNFDMEKHEYETFAIVECYTQDGGYNDCRIDLIKKLDAVTIETFRKENF